MLKCIIVLYRLSYISVYQSILVDINVYQIYWCILMCISVHIYIYIYINVYQYYIYTLMYISVCQCILDILVYIHMAIQGICFLGISPYSYELMHFNTLVYIIIYQHILRYTRQIDVYSCVSVYIFMYSNVLHIYIYGQMSIPPLCVFHTHKHEVVMECLTGIT